MLSFPSWKKEDQVQTLRPLIGSSLGYSFPSNLTFDCLKLISTYKFIKIKFITMYQNLLVYISQTLTYWHNYVPTQEPVNRCPWQPGWYQGGKAGRGVFVDCLTFNTLTLCTGKPMTALPAHLCEEMPWKCSAYQSWLTKGPGCMSTLHWEIPHHMIFLSKNVPPPLWVAGSLLPRAVMGISTAQKEMG